MSTREQAANLGVYSAPDVVAHYAGLGYLTACEQLLFDTYLRPGMAILDLGVGGGRTTPHLSALASRYVGVDYSDEMIRACRGKFPHLRFEVADASDLSQFEEASFDAVVFSFNGLDCLAPDDKRENCLCECHRILRPGGIFIFSSHNPRSLFLDWQWDRDHLRVLASKVAAREGIVFELVLAALTCGRAMLGVARSLARAVPRARRRLPTAAFWSGEGYIFEPAHGGLLMHFAIPARTFAELTRFGFKLLQVLPENHPARPREYTARWYYYAFAKD